MLHVRLSDRQKYAKTKVYFYIMMYLGTECSDIML
jgi:hypothetical protein